MMCCASSYAQTIIQMEEYGGVYRIPCKVNGAKMKLIFDTGAESVCISLTMAEYLFDNDFISSDDIIGTGTSAVADGRIVDHVIINIKDIEIEGIHLTNVRAVVIDGQNAPLLLGQSAIQKLGPVEIKGNVLTIKNGAPYDEEYINKLFNEANTAYENNLYGKAVEKYSQLYAMNQLSDYGIYLYAKVCWLNNNDKQSEELLNQISDYSYFEKNGIDIYRLYGHIYYDLERYSEAVNYYQLSIKKIQNESSELIKNLKWIADCYYYDKNFTKAYEYYSETGELFAREHNVDVLYLHRDCTNKLKKNEISYRNDEIDYIHFRAFRCAEKIGMMSWNTFLSTVAELARARNKYAMKYCNEIGLDPYSSLWY